MYDKAIRFQNHNGLNLFSIRVSEIGNYFRFKQPLVTIWWDCSGSVGKCLSLLPYSPEYRNQVRDQLTFNLNEDFTNRYAQLKKIIDPLLLLFPAGEFSLTFHNGKTEKYHGDTPLAYNNSNAKPVEWDMILANAINVNAQQQKLKEYLHFSKALATAQQPFEIHVKGHNISGFYDGQSLSFIATQPAAQLDGERVKYFEEQIKKGFRPFAIVFNCQLEQLKTNKDGSISGYSLYSDNYVIDGHHKLQAYHNLKIVPPIAEITHCPATRDEIHFDIEELIDVLYPWHIEHILKNWGNNENFIRPYLENRDSKIHAFTKNGYIKRFNHNGNLYEESFYVNDKKEGEEKVWYDNGQLHIIGSHKSGVRVGTWHFYYESGELQYLQTHNEIGELHGLSAEYYRSGKKRSEDIYINNQLPNDCRITWHENGAIAEEVHNKNGRLFSIKRYDNNGTLTSFEEWDASVNAWVRRI